MDEHRPQIVNSARVVGVLVGDQDAVEPVDLGF